MIARSKESLLRNGIIASTGRPWRAAKAFSLSRENNLIPDEQIRLPWESIGWSTFTKLNVVFEEKQKSTNGGKIINE